MYWQVYLHKTTVGAERLLINALRRAKQLVQSGKTAKNNMYNMDDDRISILFNNGTLHDIAEVSDLIDIQRLSHKKTKYYLCYHRV